MNTSLHWRTPTAVVTDPRGNVIRQVDYLRRVAGEDVQALITRQQYDVAGRLVALRDPRLPTPNTTTVHRLDGVAIRTINVDGGENTVLQGVGGELLQNWDANRNHREMTYDPQLRLRAVTENGAANFETFHYLDASADPTHNLRGQMTALSDPSGTLALDSFGMHGQTLEETRTFKDGKTCTSRRVYSAVGAVLQTTDAGGHLQQSTYDIAGQLVQVQLQLNGQAFQPVLKGADYNAAGQITEQRLGNDVTNRWCYRDTDGRLLRQYAQKASEPAILDFGYEYDLEGNVTRIVDHTYTPTFFRNQRVDGERTFGYDSVYRLTRATGYSDAPPADNSGRPQPTDPDDRRNYVESFEYDDGNNLKKLTHVRDGNTYTREVFIDTASNRGVRWKQGDPVPDFGARFDPTGNLRHLQAGQPLHWNSRNQLQSLTLVEHVGGPPDQELYQYSRGTRVYKRHETHTRKVSHVDEVHYAGSLEIRSKSSGEELHRITVAIGVGEVSCLHWVAGKPSGIDADQLQYSLSDHLGSITKTLDARALLISAEGYFAFGGTAWMAARSQIEADYKFIRYSGKEMDRTGLYYYGARYYVPWLSRWINADPAGDADGPNRYAFVGNNPLRYVDSVGAYKTESTIRHYSDFISVVFGHSEHLLQQLHNIFHKKNIKRNLAANFAVEVGKGVAGYEAGVFGAGLVELVLPSPQSFIPYLTTGGLIGGNIGGDIVGSMIDPFTNEVASRTGIMLGPLIPQTSKMSVSEINKGLGITDPVRQNRTWREASDDLVRQTPAFLMNRVMASWLSIIPAAIAIIARAIEAEDIKNGLDPVKIIKIETMLSDWQAAVESYSAAAEGAFDALGIDVLDPDGIAPISRSDLQQQTHEALANIGRAKASVAAYRESRSTDNQFLQQQLRHTPVKHSRLYNWWTKSNGTHGP